MYYVEFCPLTAHLDPSTEIILIDELLPQRPYFLSLSLPAQRLQWLCADASLSPWPCFLCFLNSAQTSEIVPSLRSLHWNHLEQILPSIGILPWYIHIVSFIRISH